MKRNSITPILILCFIFLCEMTISFASTTVISTKVKLPTAIHFLSPAGDDVQIEPGMYHIEGAESWLKLVPEGEEPASAVLLDATVGTHEESMSEPTVRLVGGKDNPDVFHLAMLLPDGTGLEAVGTESGIRPRAVNLAILAKPTGQAPTMATAQRAKRARVPNNQLAPLQPQGQNTCGPNHTQIPRSAGNFRKPAVAIHQNQLYVMALGKGGKVSLLTPELFIYNGKNWAKKKTTDLRIFGSGAFPAIASFQNRLHVVFNAHGKGALTHRILNGSKWEPGVFPNGIVPNQTSKAGPTLAVLQNKLHMVHLGESSNTLWHSIFDGRRWTPNVPIPNQKSQRTPDLVAEPSRLHMVYLKDNSNNLMHTQFTGNQWTTPFFVKAGRVSSKSSTTPALTYNGQIEARLQLIFSANSSSHFRSAVYGIQEGSTTRQAKWYDERNLLNLTSEGSPSGIFYQGCVHLVYPKNGSLWHSQFAPEDGHPSVR